MSGMGGSSADHPSRVRVELYGVPRLICGTGEMEVDARSVGELLDALIRRHPALEGRVISRGSLHRAYRLNRNGREFLTRADHPISHGDCLILMSADAGG
jgi:molybdopterin converting factor small subunit